MMGVDSILAIGMLALAGLTLTVAALITAWQGCLHFTRLELAHDAGEPRARSGGRIELADLRERVRKLEAIASGIEL
jgi:hypothetical protein